MATSPNIYELNNIINSKGTVAAQAYINENNLTSDILANQFNYPKSMLDNYDLVGSDKKTVEHTQTATDYSDKIFNEILAQKTMDKWSTGSGLSKEAAARMMADKLSNYGITKLTDFGQRDQTNTVKVTTGRYEYQPILDEYGNYSGASQKVFVPGEGQAGYFTTQTQQVESGDGYSDVTTEVFVPLSPEQQSKVKDGQLVLPTGQKEYYNKSTGKAIATEYDRAGANDWGGTFAGDSSSGFGVQFKADGTPIFYTHYDTVDQLGGLGTMISVLSIIPSPIQPFAMAANAAIAAEKGDLIGAIASAAGAGGFENVAAAANFANAVKNEDLVLSLIHI
jgi:hypothetical protein